MGFVTSGLSAIGSGLSSIGSGIASGASSVGAALGTSTAANIGTLLSTGAQIGTGVAGIVQANQARGDAQRQFQQQQDLIKEQESAVRRQGELTDAQRNALLQKQEQQRRAALFQGRSGTILTSPSGLISGGSQGKTLLGL